MDPDANTPSRQNAGSAAAADLILLRNKLLALSYRCPKGHYTANCPFPKLAGLTHATRESTLRRLGEPELRRSCDLVPECAGPAEPRQAGSPEP